MSEAEDQFQPQCVDTRSLTTCSRTAGLTTNCKGRWPFVDLRCSKKTACFHTSASFYGSDRLEARAQRQSPREQMQLDTLTPEPLRQVPRKTQLMLARCTPRLALAPRSPQAWWLALRATERLQIVLISAAPPSRQAEATITEWSQLEQAQHTPCTRDPETPSYAHPSSQVWAWT